MRLLTESNPKTNKGTQFGYLTAILHLAPSDLSGYQVCPMATEHCRAACLNLAGQGGIFKNGVLQYDQTQLATMVRDGLISNRRQTARIRRTHQFFRERDIFFSELQKDIDAHIKMAARLQLKPCIRLNGTSDLTWERIRPYGNDKTIIDLYPSVQFYDYTKIIRRVQAPTVLPANYHLTFSISDVTAPLPATSHNMAVVFRTPPREWNGKLVVNGDVSDLRFLDPPNVIVGLKAKGIAKRLRSVFIVD